MPIDCLGEIMFERTNVSPHMAIFEVLPVTLSGRRLLRLAAKGSNPPELHVPTSEASESVRSGTPFAIDKPQKFFPNIVTARIRAQEGLFVVCSSLEIPLDEKLREDWTIERVRVPADKKKEMRYHLFRIGMHDSAMFPDVDGLAKRIR
jgi:hypothetical protein